MIALNTDGTCRVVHTARDSHMHHECPNNCSWVITSKNDGNAKAAASVINLCRFFESPAYCLLVLVKPVDRFVIHIYIIFDSTVSAQRR